MGFWDSAFSVPGYKYGEAPNAFLAAEEQRFPRGTRILVPGDGEGRNGVWLATRGHRVTTVDSSRVGIEKARALAQRHGVAVDIREGDLETWTPEAGAFDAVVSIYLHLPAPLRQRVHRALAAAVAPGGWFLLEAFHPRQRLEGHTSGGPRDIALLYTLEMLRADIADAGLTEVVGWEGETTLDEGEGHRGQAVVTRLLARRD